jgi:hypothetical protein
LVRRAGFGWSDRPDDAVPQADRERVVAGALIQEELAWLRDESFDLDLIGFDATELERLLALADGEAGSGDAEDEFPSRPKIRSQMPGYLWLLGNPGCCAVTPRCWPTSSPLDGQLADMTFRNPPYNVDYANTPKDKHRAKHRRSSTTTSEVTSRVRVASTVMPSFFLRAPEVAPRIVWYCQPVAAVACGPPRAIT